MKPKTGLLLNSTWLILLSPMLGIMFAGLVLAVIEAILLTVAVLFGFNASIFFSVDYISVVPHWETVKTISMWVIFVGGAIGELN